MGSWIFCSSTPASGAVGPHCAASKAGTIGPIHSYASNLVKEGIATNMVCRAVVETDMVRADLRIAFERILVGGPARVGEGRGRRRESDAE